MYDAPKIILGIIVFVLLVSSPLWLNLSGGNATKPPDIIYPAKAKECVETKGYMKLFHMDLLNRWRDKVVRQNQRYVVKAGNNVILNGEKMEMSFSKACMRCHDNKEQFCDRCHNYLDVKPYCWDCHNQPKGAKL